MLLVFLHNVAFVGSACREVVHVRHYLLSLQSLFNLPISFELIFNPHTLLFAQTVKGCPSIEYQTF